MVLFKEDSLDGGEATVPLFGTFWRYVFGNNNTEFERYLDAAGQIGVETMQQLNEFSDSVAKDKVPVLSTQQWFFLPLLESSSATSESLKIKYGNISDQYGDGHRYGQIADSEVFSFDLPKDVVEFSHLYNHMTRPTDILVNNFDYVIDPKNHVVHFLANPFDNANLAIRTILDDDGNAVDRELGFWAADTLRDERHIFTHFGYVLDIFMESSELYRDFISASWSILNQGPSKASFNRVFSALTGIPLSKGAETVEKILVQNDSLFIITDLTVYQYKSSAAPLVAVGDVIKQDQILVDSLVFIEIDDPSELTGVLGFSLGKRFGYDGGPLFFGNKEVSLDYMGTDVDGRAVVQFELGGTSSDITKFWRSTHLSGINSGKTLANFLDTRANPVNEPGPVDLPGSLNPFLFLMDNLFKNNLYIVKVTANDIADGAPGLSSLASIIEYLPPHTTFVVFVELDQGTDTLEDAVIDGAPAFQPGIHGGTDVTSGNLTDRGISFRTIKDCEL